MSLQEPDEKDTSFINELSDINKEQALKMLIEVIDTNLEDASCK